MTTEYILDRPVSFYSDKRYLYWMPSLNNHQVDPSIVRFSSYTASPAFVIVEIVSGQRIRCPRDDLFEINAEEVASSATRINPLIERLEAISARLERILLPRLPIRLLKVLDRVNIYTS
jgi:hypothetical protein